MYLSESIQKLARVPCITEIILHVYRTWFQYEKPLSVPTRMHKEGEEERALPHADATRKHQFTEQRY